MVSDVCLTLGVDLLRGQLVQRCDDIQQLADAIHRIAQAVVRVSDIWFSFRTRPVESIADEVDEWLNQQSFEFKRAVKCGGRSGREWTVDYQIVVRAHTSLVFVLSSGSRAAARRVSEHVFTGCFDLLHLRDAGQASLVSLFDDTADVWQSEDINLAQHVSETVMWSRPDELERVLTMA